LDNQALMGMHVQVYTCIYVYIHIHVCVYICLYALLPKYVHIDI
jgi:hypothetical protein